MGAARVDEEPVGLGALDIGVVGVDAALEVGRPQALHVGAQHDLVPRHLYYFACLTPKRKEGG